MLDLAVYTEAAELVVMTDAISNTVKLCHGGTRVRKPGMPSDSESRV
jgi:hypothetical protein